MTGNSGKLVVKAKEMKDIDSLLLNQSSLDNIPLLEIRYAANC